MPGFRKKSRRNRSRRKSLKRRQSRRNKSNGGRRYRQRGGDAATMKTSFGTDVKSISNQLRSKDPDAPSKTLKEKVQGLLTAVDGKIDSLVSDGTYDAKEPEITDFKDKLAEVVEAVKKAEDNKKPAPGPLAHDTNGEEKDLLLVFVTAIENATGGISSGAFNIETGPFDKAAADLEGARRGSGSSGSGSGSTSHTVSIVSTDTVVKDEATGEEHTVKTDPADSTKLIVTSKTSGA